MTRLSLGALQKPKNLTTVAGKPPNNRNKLGPGSDGGTLMGKGGGGREGGRDEGGEQSHSLK